MTPLELEIAAQLAIGRRARLHAEHGPAFDGPAELPLVLWRLPPRGRRVRLSGSAGPWGEVLDSSKPGQVVAMFGAAAVLAYARRLLPALPAVTP